jgi:hypothetical protein
MQIIKLNYKHIKLAFLPVYLKFNTLKQLYKKLFIGHNEYNLFLNQ